jgi:hypothetical protein
MSEATKLKDIPQDIIDAAHKMASSVKWDAEEIKKAEDGNYTPVIDEGVWLNFVKDETELSADQLNDLRKANEKFVAVAGHAIGFGAVDNVYNVNDKITGVLATFGTTGRDSIVIESKRHTATPNPRNREEIIDSYGTIRAIVNTSLENKKAGYFGTVASHVKNYAEEALKNL